MTFVPFRADLTSLSLARCHSADSILHVSGHVPDAMSAAGLLVACVATAQCRAWGKGEETTQGMSGKMVRNASAVLSTEPRCRKLRRKQNRMWEVSKNSRVIHIDKPSSLLESMCGAFLSKDGGLTIKWISHYLPECCRSITKNQTWSHECSFL